MTLKTLYVITCALTGFCGFLALNDAVLFIKTGNKYEFFWCVFMTFMMLFNIRTLKKINKLLTGK